MTAIRNLKHKAKADKEVLLDLLKICRTALITWKGLSQAQFEQCEPIYRSRFKNEVTRYEALIVKINDELSKVSK